MAFPAKTFPSVRKAVELKNAQVTAVARSCHFVGSPGMQIGLDLYAGGLTLSQWLSAREARELGQALIDAASHFETQALRAGWPVTDGTLQQGNVDLEPAEHQSAGPAEGFDRRAAA